MPARRAIIGSLSGLVANGGARAALAQKFPPIPGTGAESGSPFTPLIFVVIAERADHGQVIIDRAELALSPPLLIRQPVRLILVNDGRPSQSHRVMIFPEGRPEAALVDEEIPLGALWQRYPLEFSVNGWHIVRVFSHAGTGFAQVYLRVGE